MNSIATYSKHPQPIQWQLVMGMEYCANGSNPEATLSRLCNGFDPMEAGR
jgi:hypothetical protein